MPTAREILYAFFILVVIVIVGWFLLEVIDRLDNDPAAIGWEWMD
jgi:hypothetical protein